MSDLTLTGRYPPGKLSPFNATAEVVSVKMFERRLRAIAGIVGSDVLTLTLEDLRLLVRHIQGEANRLPVHDPNIQFLVMRSCHYENAIALREKIIAFKGDDYVVKQ